MTAPAAGHRARRARLGSVLAVVVGGALALISSTQTWIDVTLRDGARETLHVAGADALPLLAPLSLAALALGLALTIAGRVTRYVFGVIAVAIGAGLLAGAWRVAAEHPIDAVTSTVAEATGLTGTDTVGALVASLVTTPWPYVAIVTALLVAAGGILTLVTARTWSGAGRRYRTAAEPAAGGPASSRPHDAIDSWDDLSRGDDPTR